MKDHKELKTLVIMTLEGYNSRDICPKAQEIYRDIAHSKPGLVRNGFKSFVKVINSFKEVEAIVDKKGEAMVYKAK